MSRHQCVRCGRNQPRERLVFSRFTRNYYCSPKWEGECNRRAARRAQDSPPSPLLEQAVGLARSEFDRDTTMGDAMLAATVGLHVVRGEAS